MSASQQQELQFGWRSWQFLLLFCLMSLPAFGDDVLYPAAPVLLRTRGTRRVEQASAWVGDDSYEGAPAPTVVIPPASLQTQWEPFGTRNAFLDDPIGNVPTPAIVPEPSNVMPAPWESQLTTLEERLDEMDETDTSLQDAITELEGDRVLVGTSNATIKLSGRVHVDYWAFPGADAGIIAFEEENPQDRIGFRRVRFGVGGDIGQSMVYRIEMESAGGNNPTFKDVFLGFEDLPFLQTVLIGNQKRPYGLDHINSSRYNVFMERPFIIEAHNQDARRLGIQSWGVSDDEAWNWRYGVFEMQDTQNVPFYIGDAYQLEVAGRLANTWFYECDGENYGHIAIAGTVAHPDATGGPMNSNQAQFQTRPEARSNERWLNTGRIAGAQWYEILAFETVYNEGPLQLVGELQSSWVQREGFEDTNFWGAYAYAAYFLTGEHLPWDRETGQLDRMKPRTNFFLVDNGCGCWEEGWGAWQVAARYSYADFTSEDIFGGVGHSMTLGLNWHWNPNARLQFNYLHGWIDEHAPVDGQTEGEYDIIGMPKPPPPPPPVTFPSPSNPGLRRPPSNPCRVTIRRPPTPFNITPATCPRPRPPPARPIVDAAGADAGSYPSGRRQAPPP